jgi:hypothetical protein
MSDRLTTPTYLSRLIGCVKGSVPAIYVCRIDPTPTCLSHLNGCVNIFTMFLHVSVVTPISFFVHMKHTN